MRDKDTLVLESLYSSILVEGKKEVENYLKKLFGDTDSEETIKRIVDTVNTSSKEEGNKMGRFIKIDGASVDDVIAYCEIFFYLKKKGNSGLDLNRFKTFNDLRAFVDQKAIEVIKKLVPSTDQLKELAEADQSTDKTDTFTLARFTAEAIENNEDISDVIGHYREFLKIKARNIPEFKPMTAFATWKEFKEFVHDHYVEEGNKEKGTNLQDQAIYEDDNIKVWRADNVKESINYTHNLYGNHSWCIGYAIGKSTGIQNQYINYSLSRTYSPSQNGHEIGSTFYMVDVKAIKDKKRGNGFFALEARPYGLYEYTPAENGTKPLVNWSELLKKYVPELNKKPSGQIKYQPVKIKPNVEDLNPEMAVGSEDQLPTSATINSYQELFKFIKPSEKVVNKMKKFETLDRKFDENTFDTLSPNEKSEYVQLGYLVNAHVFKGLDDTGKNQYLSAGNKLDTEIFNLLSKDEKSLWMSTRSVNLINMLQESNDDFNELDMKLVLESKNKNLFSAVLTNAKASEMLLDYVNKIGSDDPRILDLIAASPKRSADYVVKWYKDKKSFDGINPKIIVSLTTDIHNALSFTTALLIQPIDVDKIPDIIKNYFKKTPRSAMMFINRSIMQGKKIAEIDPSYLAMVSTDSGSSLELLDGLMRNQNDFGDVPHQLVQLISGVPEKAYQYVMYLLTVKKVKINKIDLNLLKSLSKYTQGTRAFAEFIVSSNQWKTFISDKFKAPDSLKSLVYMTLDENGIDY